MKLRNSNCKELFYKFSFLIKIHLCSSSAKYLKSIFFKNKETMAGLAFFSKTKNKHVSCTWFIYVIALQMGKIMSELAFLFSCNRIFKIFNYTKVSFKFPQQIHKYENANLEVKSPKCELRGYHIQKCIQTTFSRNRNLTSYM